MSGDPYVYPGTSVLRNRLGITDDRLLDEMERQLVTMRQVEGVPSGNFDIAHLRSIHRHLFQDVYDWAGEMRTVEISKGGNQFIPRQRIVSGMADVHSRLFKYNMLRGLDADQFAAKAGEIIGDVNHVHPFREGNGRTQLEYLRQLADQAGHRFAQARLVPDRWIDASRAAHLANFGPMAAEIRRAIVDRQRDAAGDRVRALREAGKTAPPTRDRDKDRDR